MLILLCATGLYAQQNGSRFGEITELTGTVELKPAGSPDFIPAKTGDTVAPDTIISTGFKSSALVKAGSAVLTVRPLTRLSLSEISSSAGTETLNVSLQTGRVRVDAKPPSGTKASMAIISPMATASVRGTSFEFDTQSLTVLEGTVAFQGNNGGAMLINAGSAGEINANGRSIDPVETFASALAPQPPMGSDTGYINSGTSVLGTGIFNPTGEFVLSFVLH